MTRLSDLPYGRHVKGPFEPRSMVSGDTEIYKTIRKMIDAMMKAAGTR